MSEHQQTQQSKKPDSTFQKQAALTSLNPVSHPASIIQRARINPKSLTSADVLQLQRTIGNRAVGRLLSEIRNPSKVQQAPIQRQEIPEEEEPLQGKMAELVQRQEIPEEEEPLQGKMIETVQQQEIPEEEEPLQGKFENNPEKETCPSCMQRQEIPEDEEPLQGKFETIQRLEPEDEEKLQMKSAVQRQEIPEEEEPLQGKMIGTVQRQEIPEEEEPLQIKKENNTGMPNNLKAGVESLSGIDMSDVKVHYNSDKPAEVGALAYTQGTNIHVAPGQERHLPHEAWHVVQQMQGRVKPTMQLKDGILVNDDYRLECEANAMGGRAIRCEHEPVITQVQPQMSFHTVQRFVQINSPLKKYEKLPELIGYVRKPILAMASEHKDNPFYERVKVDILFFEQIVKDIFERDETYDTMKQFTDEIVQVGMSKAQFNPEKYTKEDWALLHRMESLSFRRFIAAKESKTHDKVLSAEYEKTESKYDPSKYGEKTGKHTWRGNEEWLVYVIQHFSKLVLTDLPLTIDNVFRGKRDRISMEKVCREKNVHIFSAYAREIAALLHEHYLPLSAKDIGTKNEQKISALTLVREDVLPPSVAQSVRSRCHIDFNVANWIAKGDSTIGLGKELGDNDRVLKALSFFIWAGIPTRQDRPMAYEESRTSSKPLSWARRDLQPSDPEKELMLKQMLEKEAALQKVKAERGELFKKIAPEDFVLNPSALIELINKSYGFVQTFYRMNKPPIDFNPKKQYNKGKIVEFLLETAKKHKYVSDKMSKSKFLNFIKSNSDIIWPNES